MKRALVISRQAIFDAIGLKESNFGEYSGKIGDSFYSLEPLLASRHTCEKNSDYLQIIPYITLMNSDTREVFVYTRGKAGDEGRLRDKVSIGVGGHIDTIPNSKTTFLEILVMEALREIEEEVGIKYSEMDPAEYATIKNSLMEMAPQYSYIYNNTDEVGKVHFGVSIVISVTNKDLGALEEEHITNTKWMTIRDLIDAYGSGELELEAWAKIVMFNVNNVFSSGLPIVPATGEYS
ncbi:MAG: hypothetical protein ACD_84C00040G0005 [uncultured bacterium]|nr:MAG: hypothetical protein ACD_84C00040G0005 [uncultured bacterium]